MTRRLLASLIAASAVSTVVGVLMDAKGFTVNVLAGVLGTALGVLVAIWLVERMLQRERAKQWEAVSGHLHGAVYRSAADIAAVFYIHQMPSVDATDAAWHAMWEPDPTDAELLAVALGKLAFDIESRAEQLGAPGNATIVIGRPGHEQTVWRKGDPKHTIYVESRKGASKVHTEELHEASSSTLFGEVDPEFRYMRDVMYSRLMLLEDVALTSLLGEVEAAHRHWRQWMGLVEDDWGAPEEIAWQQAAAFLRTLIPVVLMCGADGSRAPQQ